MTNVDTAPDSSASFGIDHPLIAVHEIEHLRQRLIGIGFNMTAIGKHPWGTSTSLAIFPDCLLEIMGIYNDQRLDEKPAGNFRFGRHVYDNLQQREGVALTALHSTHSLNDAEHAKACGFELAGHLEFGRDVQLPDGSADRTKTTLALLPDTNHPRLSFFLCQQHRRELIEVDQWMQHPNTVCGINGIIIHALPEQQTDIRGKLSTLYGNSQDIEGGFGLQTPNGTISVLNEQSIRRHYGAVPEAVLQDRQAAIVGMDFRCEDLSILKAKLDTAGMDYHEHIHKQHSAITLSEPELTGNTLFTFHEF